jgi:A/G-specific adenine glycosylase
VSRSSVVRPTPGGGVDGPGFGLDGVGVDVDFDRARRDAFRRSVLAWYGREGRRLPFRGTTDPYLVLVSETILQQTQVSRGGPAWQVFTARFPTVEALAASSPADVVRAWQGLGYDRRAINLRRAAKVVVDELGGRFPRDVAGLERLPGVGPYTARAVASIAYGLPVGAVDTNVRRVLGRALAGDAASLSAPELQAVADALAHTEQPGDWTAALMDLGSTICRPRGPRCDVCPVAAFCRYAGVRAPTGDPTTSRATAPDPDPARPARAVRERPVPFERSNRWLRGRILDRLRAVEGDSWEILGEPIGDHDRPAVRTALLALAADGLVELAGDDVAASAGAGTPVRARLPPA